MLSVKGIAAAAAAAAAKAKMRGQKKSCDLCVFRKRKCDGALPSCGFCLSRGSECHYSPRRPNRPRGYAKLFDRGNEGESSGQVEVKPSSGLSYARKESCGMQQKHKASPSVGWKRIRLSASPATGLVGTKENAFLGSFFSCLGFLPLTHERLISRTLMELLLASSSGETVDKQALEASGTSEVERSPSTMGGKTEGGGVDAASACALWCSIAMGALVQGQPLEQVAPYMHHAWTSLSQCFDTCTVEIGRAFLMMAYLHNFMGDDHKFCRYLELSRKVVDHLLGSTVETQEIDDMLMMGNDTRIFHTAALVPAELDAYCTDKSPKLEVPDVVHKSDLCRILLQADRRMMKAFLRDHRVQATQPLQQREELAFHGSGDDMDNGEIGATAWKEMFAEGGDGERGYLSGMSIKMDGASLDSTKIGDEINPSRPGDETWKYTVEARDVISRLGEAAEAPEVRGGVGSLLYNSILGYLDMVTGSTEIEASYEKVKHCVGIISRYPGLCRFSTWRHLSHCQLSFLSKRGDAELFEELRHAYNSVRAEGAPEVPPHAEWAMIGLCDHIFCRSMDHLGQDWGGPNAADMLISRDVTEQPWLPGESHWLSSTYGNIDHWASLAPELQSATAIPDLTLPTHECTDVMPSTFVDIGFSAQQFQHMAFSPELTAVGPLPTTHVDPAWSTAGQTPAMPPFSRVHASGSAHDMGEGAYIHTRHRWDSASSTDASNACDAYHNAGDTWRYASSMAAASSSRSSDSSVQRAFGEKMLFDAAVGGEREYRGVSRGSYSDMGEPEDSIDSYAEGNDR